MRGLKASEVGEPTFDRHWPVIALNHKMSRNLNTGLLQNYHWQHSALSHNLHKGLLPHTGFQEVVVVAEQVVWTGPLVPTVVDRVFPAWHLHYMGKHLALASLGPNTAYLHNS